MLRSTSFNSLCLLSALGVLLLGSFPIAHSQTLTDPIPDTIATSSASETNLETATTTDTVSVLNTLQSEQLVRQTRTDEQRSALLQSRTATEPVLSDRTRERIINLAANVSNRLEAAIARLEQIAARLEQRIDTDAQTGAETASARVALEVAQTSLAEARSIVSTIDEDVHKAVNAQRPREAWLYVHTLYTDTHEALRAAHTALRISINELRAARAMVY